MHKNPFATAPAAYASHQPPLPPGPPPPQPTQPDYSAYWAAAAQAQQPGAAAYNPQWSAPQPATAAPPRPPPEQSALYANYGYGGQQNYQWQQQQQQQQQQQRQQHFQPPPPVVQPPPPPPQAAYTPYQPQAGAFQQPYIPQPAAAPQQAVYTPQMPAMQSYQQPPQPYIPQQQQSRQNPRPPLPQHSPQPPAKRQRFDGPNQHRGPPQNQFQPPPPPPGGIGGGVGLGMNTYGPNQGGHSRGGPPGANQVPLGSGRGGFSGGRGGNNQGGRGRGGNMGMNSGNARGGRGGSMYGNMGGRGAGPGQGGSFRGHGSNRGFGNNRRGGSFGASSGPSFGHGHQQQQQQHHHQNFPSQGSFRGRNQGFNNSGRSNRHDPSPNRSSRDGATVSTGPSSGKKDENRRTLTDFKIIGLELEDLSWSWGTSRKVSESDATVKEEKEDTKVSAPPSDEQSVEQKHVPDVDVPSIDQSSGEGEVMVKSELAAPILPPPPSRIRIYFHTPVTADDSTISPQSSVALMSSPSNIRKGKRKKIEDDDGESEDGRGPPPPPPQHSSLEDQNQSADYDGTDMAGRDSVAPSVAETASEGDWLMAAIGEDEAEGEGENVPQSELDSLHDADAEGEPDDYGNDYIEGDVHQDMGSDLVHFDTAGEEHMGNPPAHDDDSAPPGLDGLSGHVHEHVSDASAVNSHEDGFVHPDQAHKEQLPGAPAPVSEHTDTVNSSAVEPSVKSEELPHTSADSNQNDSMQISDPSSPPGLHGVPTELDLNGTSPHVSSPPAHAGQHDLPDGDSEYFAEATQLAEQLWDEQRPQPEHPPSPSTTTVTLATGSEETSVHSDAKLAAKTDRTPSANRLSISYAAGTRRLVIDASVVQALKVFRAEGRVEVQLTITKEGDQFTGIVMEGLSESSTSYTPLKLNESSLEDPTIPSFMNAKPPLKTTLIVHLDRDRPLSEPRWVKSGDVHDWLRSMFGRMFWVAGDAADGWEKKIEVVDPDPPPTIWTVLEAWAINSSVGLPNERQRFLRTHMTETDNILEILLRLVRGERASYSQSQPVISAPSVNGPLLSALSQGSAHGAQQTHVSLAVLAIFRLAVEYARKAIGDAGKGDVGKDDAEARVGEIIRSLPSHLVYKSLDGIFKEWKVEKKGGRA